ncbi:hypothetical protein [Pseudomonas entomophila]|uniref:hypothetical protein n=1 Tax=Pseudomonas entomophila TaxID=312306 RepID=UPI00200BFAD0|nr:hypothetical protein [Pseudomonas entomophila]
MRAFQATAEQKADSQLFASNGSGSFGPISGNLQGDVERFDAGTALKRYSEIGLFNGSSDASDWTMERVRSDAVAGVNNLTQDLLGVLPLGRAASVGGKAAAAVEAKLAEQVGEAVLKGGATYVESKVIQANTTVQLSVAVTLAGGKVLPKGSVVTVADDTMKVVYPNGVSEIGSYGKAVGQPLALPGANGAKGIEIASGKFDYLFGRVASNSHNAARSNQLALEMKRLGVPDNAAGRQMLTEHLTLSAKAEGNVMSTFSNQYGKFEVRESLFMGPSGKAANFQSTFQVLDDGTRKLSTVIPLH